ncbi:gp154 [Sphingomonas phage PAU]|uniref:gp154 n=1 Tax=Sphingomonas phage PAU TaxID=1150991 RepID=UPI00025732E6|nr:gp154 [Sphingomonas phage PAU]AFF28152.1 gp154 [Sphingomonas phage PAU]
MKTISKLYEAKLNEASNYDPYEWGETVMKAVKSLASSLKLKDIKIHEAHSDDGEGYGHGIIDFKKDGVPYYIDYHITLELHHGLELGDLEIQLGVYEDSDEPYAPNDDVDKTFKKVSGQDEPKVISKMVTDFLKSTKVLK